MPRSKASGKPAWGSVPPPLPPWGAAPRAPLEANARPASRAACSRDELWRSRAPITQIEREALSACVEQIEIDLLALGPAS